MSLTIQQVIDRVAAYWPGLDRQLIMRAYEFADSAHAGQRRKSGEPYIMHPLNVANILSQIEADPQSIAGGLLHDTVEDTDYDLDDITREFGEEIAQIVDGVTKLGHLNFRSAKEEQVRNLRKMLLAMSRDMRVLIVKLADRLHNMRTLASLAEDRQKHIAEETRAIYAPLAHRLGVWRVKWELEDLCLRYLEPDAYFEIVDKLGKTRAERENDIEAARSALSKGLHAAGLDAEVQGRAKHIFSIYYKMKTQHLDFDDIGDLMALRVLCQSVGDCYAALGVVHEKWMPLTGQFTDYIAKPKSNNYRSLHTKVLGPAQHPMEVQIRTHEMHRIAEYGVAAHWRYKEGSSDPDVDKYLSWFRHIAEMETDLQESHEFWEGLEHELFESQVFVFTPQGDVIDLPAGATPVDFAYRIHTDVGHQCVGAKVDGQLVPLDYEFRNGQVAEIITQRGTQPSRDWLRFARSSHARSKIRRFLRQQTRDENIARGKEALEREIAGLRGSQRRQLDMSRMDWVAQHLNYQDVESLYAALGYADVDPTTVVNHLLQPVEPESLAEEVAMFAPSRGPAAGNGPQVTTEGVKGFRSRPAKCCAPIPGDDIVGYITRGGGLAIHRADCKNLIYRQEREPERVIPLSWDNEDTKAVSTDIEVTAVDRVGLFSHITAVVSDLGLSIRAAEAHLIDEHLARLVMTVDIKDRRDLNELIQHLSQLIDVVSARPLTGMAR